MRTLAFVGSLNRKTPLLESANGRGISVFSFDEETGDLSLLCEMTSIDNPSFLAVNALARRLYAVWENEHWPDGLVSAFEIEPRTGELRYINSQPTLGNMTCHVAVHDGFVFVSNFSVHPQSSSKAFSVFPLRLNGGLEPAVAALERQSGSNAHSFVVSPDGLMGLGADRGLDQLFLFKLPLPDGELTPITTIDLPTGSGPRHVAFHPNGKWIFVVAELSCQLFSLSWDQESHRFKMRQAISTLPESFIGQNSCAEIDISADGKSVYASNRGHDSIAIFLLSHDGQLISKGHVASGGKTPRNFSIDPSGMFIVVANQESDLITILRRNPSDGKLTQTGKFIHSGTPMRIAMARFDF